MMRRFVVVLLAFLPLGALAQEYRFDPPNPTSNTLVTLHVNTMWRDSCRPRNARVTRSGNVVTVMWDALGGGQCLGSFTPWQTEVSLGFLNAGMNEVRLRVEDFQGVSTLATLGVMVPEGSPRFTAWPSYVATDGGTILLEDDAFCSASSTDVKRVTVDSMAVPFTVDGRLCSVSAQFPPHAAGRVDVTVQFRETLFEERALVQYIDPAAVPDPAVFERVLIPVMFNGPGAFSSVWRTEAELHNFSSQRLHFLPAVMQNYICDVGADCFSVPSLGKSTLHQYEDPKGAVLFIPREIANDIKYGLLVRDTSRETVAWGSEVPVVRERDATRKTMVLANVPFHPLYRLTLRLYSLEGGPGTFKVAASDSPQVSKEVALEPACGAPPCNSMRPGFAAVDLGALMPELANKGAQTLTIQVPDDGRLYWGFVSITNNNTQVVTTVSPQ